MKRILLLCGLLASFACTKDLTENTAGESADQQTTLVVGSKEGAELGTIAVKLRPDVAAAVDKIQKTRTGEQTRSGVDQMDLVFNQIGVERFHRIMPYNEEREQAYRDCGLSYWYRIYFDSQKSLEDAVNLLKTCVDIEVVEYTHLPKKMSVGPVRPLTDNTPEPGLETRAALPMNDPQLSKQWHFKNEGPTGDFPNRKAGADVNVFDAWNICTGGTDIIVAVLDEPVQYSHPDLEANMWTSPDNGTHGYNFYNRKAELDWKTTATNIYGDPEYADHGTHVAGTIAAVNNNGIGCSGIAGGKNGGGVKIMSCQILGNSKVNRDNDADIKAFTYAADNGAVIAQCSWGYDASMAESDWNNGHGSRRAAIDYFINNAGSKNPKFPGSPISGGLVIFAAGNDGHNVQDKKTWPSAYAPVIAVASIGWDFQPSYFTDYGSWVDVTAPGGDYQIAKPVGGVYYSETLSTILQDPTMTFRDGRNSSGCGFMQGTSMACPHVSGVAALGLAYASKIGKRFTPSEFASLLLSSTYDIDAYLTGTKRYINDSGASRTLTLSNYKKGMGRGGVDALRLLLAIKGTPAVNVKQNVATAIDLSKFFGGTAATLTVKSVEIDAAGLQQIGISAAPSAVNGILTFSCPKIGSAMVKVSGLAGDMPVTREFAVIVRDNVPSNGGWL